MNETGNFAKTEHVETSYLSQVRDVPPTDRTVPPAGTLRGTRVPFLLCLIALVGVMCPPARSQAGQWDWVGASTSSAYGKGAFGTKGVPASTNVPSARVRASTWVDASGKVWMFGGLISARSYNDLWEYDPSTGWWTWMSGGQTVGPPPLNTIKPLPASYGTLGVPAASNLPGARSGSVTWIDSGGKLWLFGGSMDTADQMNDIWVYDPSTTYWTWMGGSDGSNTLGAYGTLGVVNSNNWPGARDRAAFWTDSSGNLWLFGGWGYDLTTGITNPLNDLWKLDTKSLQWTWMGGSQTAGQAGTYGTKGTSTATNIPGARYSASSWTDTSGNFWLFGGTGYATDPSQAGSLDDLWEYSSSTGRWTWVSGDTTTDVAPVYGSVGVESASNTPGGRWGGAAWIDDIGNLWLSGGQLPVDTRQVGDLWRFNVSSGNWTLMGGTTDPGTPPVYSEQGVADSSNDPGGKMDQATWTDSAGNFWFFGGAGYGNSTGGPNDLWEYQFPAAAAPVFNPPGNTYNFDQTVTISDSTSDAVIYYTTDGSTPTIHSTLYSAPITADTPQTLKAIAVASGYLSSPVASADYKFNRLTAATPVISPPSGAYSTAPTVIITDATQGATIYYTTNGTMPTTHSNVYGGPFTINPPATIEALAVASQYSNSAVAMATYTRPTVATPVFNPPAGTYNSTQFVTVTDATPGATIYYTTDGSTPTTSSAVYSGTITVSANGFIQALAVASGYNDSNTVIASYTIIQPVPVISDVSPAFPIANADNSLTITGSNFIPGSTVLTGAVSLATQYVSSTQLTAQLPASQVPFAGAPVGLLVKTPGAPSVSDTLQVLPITANATSLPFTLTPSSTTVSAGSTASFNVSVSNGTLDNVGPFIGLPTGATALYTPTPNVNNAGTLTISTTSATPKGTYVITAGIQGKVPVPTQAGVLLPILLLPLLFLRKRLKAKGMWLTLSAGLVLLFSALSLGGCAANGPSFQFGNPTSTQAVVNATTIMLTVQ